MKEYFPNSKEVYKKVNAITNFITLCLNVVLQNQSYVWQLQERKIFGSPLKNVEFSNQIDIS